MEDYIPIEELEKIGKKEEAKPLQNTPKTDFLAITSKIFHGMWIIAKLIGFGLSRLFKALYNGLLKLNEGMEQMRKSQMGKNLKQYSENLNRNTPNLFMQPQKQETNFLNKPKKKNKPVTIY